MKVTEVAITMDTSSRWYSVSDMIIWSIEKFGSEAPEIDQISDEYLWCTRYSKHLLGDTCTMRWYFAREEYAVQFALRWL